MLISLEIALLQQTLIEILLILSMDLSSSTDKKMPNNS